MTPEEFWKKWMPRDWPFDELGLETQLEFAYDLQLVNGDDIKRAWENYRKLVEPHD